MFLGDIDLSMCFDAAQNCDAEDGNYRFQSYQVPMHLGMPAQNVTVASFEQV